MKYAGMPFGMWVLVCRFLSKADDRSPYSWNSVLYIAAI